VDLGESADYHIMRPIDSLKATHLEGFVGGDEARSYQFHHEIRSTLVIKIGFQIEREARRMIPNSTPAFACLSQSEASEDEKKNSPDFEEVSPSLSQDGAHAESIEEFLEVREAKQDHELPEKESASECSPEETHNFCVNSPTNLSMPRRSMISLSNEFSL
jgi:hypothetical protein